MMLDDAEECQLSGPIHELVPFSLQKVPRRKVAPKSGRIVYTSGRSVCDHPALAVSIGRPGDDSATAAAPCARLQDRRTRITESTACLCSSERHD